MSFDYSQLGSLDSASIGAAELPTHGFPHPSEITLATINYYDNGADTRGKWHGSRYALNWQLFTLTEPFTPSKKLSAWSGATQMHDPDFFVHYLEAKNHAKNMGAECWEFYCALYRDSFQMLKDGKCKDRPLLGQFISKFPGLPSAETKATLVYWRRRDALPGHHAFSRYAAEDSRIDLERLRKAFKGAFLKAPAEQNATWYKLYKSVRNDVMVLDANRVFLLLRDYASLSALFVVIFGLGGFVLMGSKLVAAEYVGALVLQYLIVRTAAANAGVRLVTNVLALKTASAR